MRHRNETEIKIEVRNPRAVKRRLAELGFRPVKARHFESNYLFDFPDLRLRKASCLLRVRLVDQHGVLTFKGAPLRSQEYKIRQEVESAVTDGTGGESGGTRATRNWNGVRKRGARSQGNAAPESDRRLSQLPGERARGARCSKGLGSSPGTNAPKAVC